MNQENRLQGTSANVVMVPMWVSAHCSLRRGICSDRRMHQHFITDCPERIKPPEGYICKICNTVSILVFPPGVGNLSPHMQPGHFVRDCPTKHAVGDTGGKKPREGYVCRACGGTEHYLEDCLVAQQGRTERPRREPTKEIARTPPTSRHHLHACSFP